MGKIFNFIKYMSIQVQKERGQLRSGDKGAVDSKCERILKEIIEQKQKIIECLNTSVCGLQQQIGLLIDTNQKLVDKIATYFDEYSLGELQQEGFVKINNNRSLLIIDVTDLIAQQSNPLIKLPRSIKILKEQSQKANIQQNLYQQLIRQCENIKMEIASKSKTYEAEMSKVTDQLRAKSQQFDAYLRQNAKLQINEKNLSQKEQQEFEKQRKWRTEKDINLLTKQKNDQQVDLSKQTNQVNQTNTKENIEAFVRKETTYECQYFRGQPTNSELYRVQDNEQNREDSVISGISSYIRNNREQINNRGMQNLGQTKNQITTAILEYIQKSNNVGKAVKKNRKTYRLNF